MTRLLASVVVAIVAMAFPMAARGDRSQGASVGSAVQVLAPDAAFVLRAADHDARKVEAARAASTRALDARVKSFAARMVADHGRTSAHLVTLAVARAIPVRSDPGVAKLVANTFAGLEGARFDIAYMVQAVKEHETTIALFEEESRSGKDEELKAWATKALPMLREHLRQARELQATVSGAP